MSVATLQKNLKAKGFDPGPADGLFGRRTYQAMADFISNRQAPAGTGDLLALNLKLGQITTRRRLIHFFAQISHESGFLPRSENLNYSIPRLKVVFSSKRISRADCDLYGGKKGRRANQEAIANRVYGGAWGRKNLGNTEPGDGYRYRGRGLIQLTGRSNYRRTAPEFEINPELVATPAGSVKAAVDFWRSRGANPAADRDDVAGVTYIINGGYNGLEDRTTLTNKLKAIWPD